MRSHRLLLELLPVLACTATLAAACDPDLETSDDRREDSIWGDEADDEGEEVDDGEGAGDEVSATTGAAGRPTSHAAGCTRTRGYWGTHHADGVAKQIPWPTAEDTAICDTTWLGILETSPRGDAWYILGAQWVAASLNVASGADAPADVLAALAEGEDILESCEITDRARAIELAGLLDSFNNGHEGVLHCDRGGDTTGGGDDSGGGDTDGGDDSGGDTDGGGGDTDGGDDDGGGSTGGTVCVTDPDGVITCDGTVFPPQG